MSAVQALSYLRERGVTVELDGGNLVLSGADDLSAKTIERLRELKTEIVNLLQAEAAEAFLAAIQKNLARSPHAHAARTGRRHSIPRTDRLTPRSECQGLCEEVKRLPASPAHPGL